jgi:aspartate/methionine/tyrosine aminotransferase
MICLCNPLNPTGKVFTKEELTELGELAIKHDLLILSDEIWSDIVFAPHVFTSMASLDENVKQRTITITGFSKSYGLAGLRIGAILASNPRHFEAIYEQSQHSATVHGANILGQVAASTAINECQGWLKDFVTHLQKMRDITVNGLNNVNGFSCIAPEGCYVAFANIQGTGLDSAAVHAQILEKAQVAVVPGLPKWVGAGAEGYIRLSFATSEKILQEALLKIKNIFEK